MKTAVLPCRLFGLTLLVVSAGATCAGFPSFSSASFNFEDNSLQGWTTKQGDFFRVTKQYVPDGPQGDFMVGSVDNDGSGLTLAEWEFEQPLGPVPHGSQVYDGSGAGRDGYILEVPPASRYDMPPEWASTIGEEEACTKFKLKQYLRCETFNITVIPRGKSIVAVFLSSRAKQLYNLTQAIDVHEENGHGSPVTLGAELDDGIKINEVIVCRAAGEPFELKGMTIESAVHPPPAFIKAGTTFGGSTALDLAGDGIAFNPEFEQLGYQKCVYSEGQQFRGEHADFDMGPIKFSNREVTLSVWVMTQDPTLAGAKVFDMGGSNRDALFHRVYLGFGTDENAGKITYGYATGGRRRQKMNDAVLVSSTIPANTWVHVAVTHGLNAVATMYIDGKQVDSKTTTAFPAGHRNKIVLGQSLSHGDSGFVGLIQDLFLWETVLPTEEIDAIRTRTSMTVPAYTLMLASSASVFGCAEAKFCYGAEAGVEIDTLTGMAVDSTPPPVTAAKHTSRLDLFQHSCSLNIKCAGVALQSGAGGPSEYKFLQYTQDPSGETPWTGTLWRKAKCGADLCGTTRAERSENLAPQKGFCVMHDGTDQNAGVIQLDWENGNSKERQADCLRKCAGHGKHTGCELIWDQSNHGCYVHTEMVDRGNGVDHHYCWVGEVQYGAAVLQCPAGQTISDIIYADYGNPSPNVVADGAFEEEYLIQRKSTVTCKIATNAQTLKVWYGGEDLSSALQGEYEPYRLQKECGEHPVETKGVSLEECYNLCRTHNTKSTCGFFSFGQGDDLVNGRCVFGMATGVEQCPWVQTKGVYSGRYAAGYSKAMRLDDAKAKCLDLGNACKAVTCQRNGASCTVRASTNLLNSPSQEITYVPDKSCHDKTCFSSVDYFGNDIRHMDNVANEWTCQQACMLETECAFFSYVKSSTDKTIPVKRCFLKTEDAVDSVRGVPKGTVYISGPKVCGTSIGCLPSTQISARDMTVYKVLSDGHWSVDGCPDRGAVVAAQVQSDEQKAAIRCCSKDGSKCFTKIQNKCFLAQATWLEASNFCDILGYRLCNKDELEGGVCCTTGCQYDSVRVWSQSTWEGSAEGKWKESSLTWSVGQCDTISKEAGTCPANYHKCAKCCDFSQDCKCDQICDKKKAPNRRCTVPLPVCEVKKGMDVKRGTFQHAPISGVHSTSDADCSAKCDSQPVCTAWVRQPSTGNCWMTKQTNPTFQKMGDRNTGLRCGETSTSLAQCKAKCESSEKCTAINFSEKAGVCDLKACDANTPPEKNIKGTKGYYIKNWKADTLPSCMWRQTGECKSDGHREPQNDKHCDAKVSSGWSGYCSCPDGTKVNHECHGSEGKTCYEMCEGTYERTRCAAEHEQCKCYGVVYYGKDNKFAAPKLVKGSIKCDNTVFGDPLRGVLKECWCESGKSSAPVQNIQVRTITFEEEPNGVLALDAEGDIKQKENGCNTLGMIFACDSDDPKSVWDAVHSDTTLKSVGALDYGFERNGFDDSSWKSACESDATFVRNVGDANAKMVWGGTRTSFFRFSPSLHSQFRTWIMTGNGKFVKEDGEQGQSFQLGACKPGMSGTSTLRQTVQTVPFVEYTLSYALDTEGYKAGDQLTITLGSDSPTGEMKKSFPIVLKQQTGWTSQSMQFTALSEYTVVSFVADSATCVKVDDISVSTENAEEESSGLGVYSTGTPGGCNNRASIFVDFVRVESESACKDACSQNPKCTNLQYNAVSPTKNCVLQSGMCNVGRDKNWVTSYQFAQQQQCGGYVSDPLCFSPYAMEAIRSQCIGRNQCTPASHEPEYKKPEGCVGDEYFDMTLAVHATCKGDDTIKPARQPGLRYHFYKLNGNVHHLMDVDWAAFISSGYTDSLELPATAKGSWYAVKWTGQLLCPADYTNVAFRITSDDGADLYINGQLVISNDGLHAKEPKESIVALDKGYYDLVVRYFNGPGLMVFKIEWSFEQDGEYKIWFPIPKTSLSHMGNEPKTLLNAPDDTMYQPGIRYEWHDIPYDRKLEKLSNVDFEAAPIRIGSLDNIRVWRMKNKVDFFAIRFSGRIRIDKIGLYTFWLTSDDGSSLMINNEVVVWDDGAHAREQRQGSINLNPGFYDIEVRYFELTGDQILNTQWSGPGIPKQDVPNDVLSQKIFYEPINFGVKDSFTLEAVIKTEAEGSRTIMAKVSDDDDSEHENHGFWWKLEDGQQTLWVGSGDNAQRSVSGVKKVNDGKWHHLAAIRDAEKGLLMLFVDFELDTKSSDITSTKNLPIENQEAITIGIGDIQDFGSYESEAAFDLVRISLGSRKPNNFHASPSGAKRQHPSEILFSPAFEIKDTTKLTVWIAGGRGTPLGASAKLSDIADMSSEEGFLGVGVVRVSDGLFIASKMRPESPKPWSEIVFDHTDLKTADKTSLYQIVLVDAFHSTTGGDDWIAMDDVQIDDILYCECGKGFAGGECQFSDKTTCAGHGEAQADGTCACVHGWFGDKCDEECPLVDGSMDYCNSHGKCFETEDKHPSCTCDDGFASKSETASKFCTECQPGHFGPDCVPCECGEDGTCRDGMTGDGNCKCAKGYSGDKCSEAILAVTSPFENVSFQKGATYPVLWNSAGDIHLVIISVKSTKTGKETVIATINNTGTFQWTVADDLPEGEYTLTVTDKESPLALRESAVFWIKGSIYDKYTPAPAKKDDTKGTGEDHRGSGDGYATSGGMIALYILLSLLGVLAIVGCYLYRYKRLETTEWLMWKLGNFRFRKLRENANTQLDRELEQNEDNPVRITELNVDVPDMAQYNDADEGKAVS